MEDVSKNSLALVKQELPFTGSYAGALLASLPVVPLIATVISLVSYVTPWPELRVPSWFTGPGPFAPALVGTLPTLLLWFLLAYVCRRFTAVDIVNQHGCNSLLQHLSHLNWYIDSWYPDTEKTTCTMLEEAIKLRQKGRRNLFSRWWAWLFNKGPATPPSTGSTSATGSASPDPPSTGNNTPGKQLSGNGNGTGTLDPKKQIVQYRNDIYLSLIQRSTSWIDGSGYIHLWELMNSAEEALISVEPREDIVCEAANDEMRLNGSQIQNSEEWTNKLRLAVKNLDSLVPASSATDYLKPATLGQAAPLMNPPTTPVQPAGLSVKAPVVRELEFTPQETQARAMLRKVRETLDKFNADNWGKLIESRNQLVCTITLVGLAVFTFVEFAIIIKASPMHLITAAIFYAVGALAGLINRLYLEATNDSAIDDYNLALARLVVTPQLSGIAAVIGVLLFQHASNLNDVFTFTNITTTLLPAATFGLSPNLLVNQLKKQADDFTSNLTSTQSTTGK